MSDDTGEDVTLEEAIDFAQDMAETEVEDFEGDVPNHAPALLAARATDLGQTLTNIEMAKASERAEDPTDEQVKQAVVEDAIDIFLALGALQYEYDIDLVDAFEDRRQLVADYRAFEEAMDGTETKEEAIEAVDEHMTDELSEVIGGGVGSPLDGATPITPGENVDGEEYDHEETDKSFA